MIYFIRQDSAVKIGYTKNPKLRLSELQVSNPNVLSILLLIPGGYEDEQSLHKTFEDDKIRGEWFYLSDDIRDFIKSKYNEDMRYDEGVRDNADPNIQTRFIRNIEGYNLREMGEKLNMTKQGIFRIEDSELQGTITMSRLKRFGEALGYDLIYKYVKKKEESL